jgi:hypothetical protein
MATSDRALIDFIREKRKSLPSLSGDELDVLLHEIKYQYPAAFKEIYINNSLKNINDAEQVRADLAAFFETVEKRLPQLSSEKQDASVSSEEIGQRASLYREGKTRAQEHVNKVKTASQRSRETYVHRLIENFPKQIHAVLQKEADAHALEEAKKTAEKTNVDSPEAARRLERSVVNTLAAPDEQKNEILRRLEAETREARNAFIEQQTLYQKTREALDRAQEALLTSPSPPLSAQKFIDTTASLIETSGLSAPQTVGQAERFTRVYEMGTLDASGIPLSGNNFFQTVAGSRPAEQATARLADGLFNRLTPDEQVAALREVFTKSLERVEKITTPAGQLLAESHMLKNAIRAGDERATPKSIGAAIQKTTSDLFQTFRGVDEQTLVVLEAIHAQALTGDWAAGEHTKLLFLQMMSLGGERVFHTALDKTGKWILEKGGGEVAKKIAATGAKGAVSTAIKGVLAGLGITTGPPGWLVSAATFLVTAIGERLLGAIGGGIRYFTSGAILEGAPIPITSSIMLVPVCVAAVLVVLFLSPTGAINLQINQEDQRQAALVEGLGIGGGEGIVDCLATPDNPVCKVEPCIPKGPDDCAWPTTGIITQGPFAHCVIGGEPWSTHDNMSAIDISTPYDTQVISIKPGRVVERASGCPDQPGGGDSTSFGCNGGWGNYVDISSEDGYVLRYAHLALQSMSLTHMNMPVSQGQVIGRVDNNGNSYGSHLHFGVVSGPSGILSVLPLSAADAEKVNGCNYNTNCLRSCPTIQTSIQ